MNSPDYEDFIDMFSVPTTVSPLPPTPVASPSHEASEDVIYDSLPPMEQSTVSESSLKDPKEQSTVSESPLKEPVDSKPPMVSKSPDPPTKKTHVKKVHSVIHRSPRSKERRNEGMKRMKNEGMRKDGTRNQGHEIPDCTRDPISGLRIKGIISNPEGFKDPLMHGN
ncbi:hypothetical protein TNCV_3943631 [Trichonephila clavipes]|nr:hypothetical protein TNCV_3943631 [Trichonephila clavipes]